MATTDEGAAAMVSAPTPPTEATAQPAEARSALRLRATEMLHEQWCESLIAVEQVDSEDVARVLEANLSGLGEHSTLIRLAENTQNRQAALAMHNHRTKSIYVAIAIAVISPLAAFAAMLIRTGSWWSLYALLTVFLTLLVPVWLIERRRKKLGVEHAPAEFSRALTDRDRALRSAVASAVRDAIRPRFVAPRCDVVSLGDGASLSSRVQRAQRTATRSRSEIESHLTRSGGAAIGVTGERGVGKSETLRHFCDDPEPRATPESGGTIGVFVAVPSAFDAREFLMLVTRRLAEAVPGRTSSHERRRRLSARRAWTVAILGGVAMFVGVYGSMGLLDEFRWTTNHTFMVVFLIGTLGYAFGLAGLRQTLRSGRSSVRVSTVDSNALKGPRRAVIAQADDLIRRIRYAETIKSSNEASAAWGRLGWKAARERTLSEVPLTEADLVAEFTELADSLHVCGYRLIVGIDEMDKLEDGEKAERFLNSVKLLFAARSCSFLVSVSTSAWSMFVRRGVDVRGVLDSSLDEIETVHPMDFMESRSLVRHRGEEMSDSQILVCHVLGCGLPREVLRSARLLSRIVRLRSGDQTLADCGPSLIDAHLAVLIEGTNPHLGAISRDTADVVRERIEYFYSVWSDPSQARDALTQLSGEAVADFPDDAQELLRQVRSYAEFLLGVREGLFDANDILWLDQGRLLAWAEAHAKSLRRMNVDLGPLNVAESDT